MKGIKMATSIGFMVSLYVLNLPAEGFLTSWRNARPCRPLPWRRCPPAPVIPNANASIYQSLQAVPTFCTTAPGGGTPSFPSCVGPVSELVVGRGAPGSCAQGLLPPWINFTLAQQGQRFARSHLASVGFGAIYGLLSSLFPDAVDVLILTRNSGTADDAAKRYMATVAQLLVWYEDFLNSPISANGSDFLTSLRNVRNLHLSKATLAAQHLSKNPNLVNDNVFSDYTLKTVLNGPFFKDLEASDIPQSLRSLPPSHWTNLSSPAVPINQNIQTMTQFAFAGLSVLFPGELGINNGTDGELWSFVHLWAVIGFVIGVEDSYNVFLQPDLVSAKEYFVEIFQTYHVPSLFNVNFRTKVMMETFLFGLWKIVGQTYNNIVTPNIILFHLLKSFIHIPANATFASLTAAEKKSTEVLDATIVPGLAGSEGFRTTTNNVTWWAIYSSGLYYHGKNYMTQSLRAKYVFHDAPNMAYPKSPK